MKKVICYIDGFNLYYGMKDKYHNKYKWLNLQSFAESFLKEGMELKEVKYFTSMINNDEQKRKKQEIYLKALEKQCDKLSIYKGNFLKKNKKCKHCSKVTMVYEEKRTDVNMACHLIKDCYSKEFDYCYIVSGDSDLIPPMEIIHKINPDSIIIAFPPNRISREMKKKYNTFIINKKKFKDSQLPNEISSGDTTITKPENWI